MTKATTPKANQKSGKIKTKTKASVKAKVRAGEMKAKKAVSKAKAKSSEMKAKKAVSKAKAKSSEMKAKKAVSKAEKIVTTTARSKATSGAGVIAQKKGKIATQTKKAKIKRGKTTKLKQGHIQKNKTTAKKIQSTTKHGRLGTTSLAYLLSGIYEAVLALPFLGWLMGFNSFGAFWVVGIIINTMAIVYAIREKKAIHGNVVGIIANVLGIVPFLGWFLHLTATILIFVSFFKEERK